jgi:acyl-CoA synthetase (NDP forming)
MDINQTVALSDASERLTYALLGEDEGEISEARKDLARAKEMSSGKPAQHVIARLIENDPKAARAAGLLD